MAQINFDLEHVPFSRRGSWWSIKTADAWEDRPAGLWLRTHHSNTVSRELMLIETIADGEASITATPTQLAIKHGEGQLELCMPQPQRIRFRGKGLKLRISSWRIWFCGLVPMGDNAWELRLGNRRVMMSITGISGELELSLQRECDATVKKMEQFTLETNGDFDFVIDDTPCVGAPAANVPGWEDDLSGVETEWLAWLASALPCPDGFTEARDLAAYINWSAVVAPFGFVQRPGMLMSKNWMDRVWSWDNCFNAMATIKQDPELAWDQFAFFFGHQHESGVWPDMINDTTFAWGHTKPPIYGWALRWMLDNSDQVRDVHLEEAYECLSLQTDFWMNKRDADQDGIPGYHHGCDSGWDNGTVFDHGGEVESPDLCAHLIIQMDVLSDIARRMERETEAASWKERADALLQRLLEHSWRGNHFVAPRAQDHKIAPEGDCLLLFVPLVLGDRLPKDVFDAMVTGLSQQDRFITEWGPATESPKSRLYTPDGYWRGPIWAPSTMLIVDGLHRGGATELAADIATRFCKLCRKSGFAENFNALTAEPLRDKAYTWTSSVFLVLASTYLK